MKIPYTRIAAFASRHWLRLGLIGCALFLLSQKQVNFNVRLGHPGSRESVPVAAQVSDGGGFFSRFHLFGGGEPDRFERLMGLEDATVDAFIERFAHVAQAEQEKFGIPASIGLAAALLYSRGGEAAAVRDLNNYFQLGCTADWSGDRGTADGACLRRYESAWTSFRDFSLTLSSGEFARLAQFGPRDYRRWAVGLEELGFQENGALASELQRTIDRYQLFRYD